MTSASTSTLSLDLDDAMSHNWIVGSNGAGKSNVLLYRLRLLAEETQKERPCALIFIDPHGDAAIRLAQALESWDNLTIVDPTYVSFGLNPLELPSGLSASERTEAIQTQVGELEAILWELFKDNLETAPRMLTIFRTSLYYLYGTEGKPTFRDLFELLLKLSQMERSEIPAMLRLGDVEDEMIAAAMAAISTLTKDAFNPGINRISKFVMPSGSMNARTFCSSGSRLDFHKMLEPGQVTVFRLPKFQLPTEFGALVSAVVVVRLFLIVQERAKEMERAGKESRERTPVILAVDEFQNIAGLSVVGTILTEARKFGLFLWMVHQNLDQLGEEVLNTVMGNAGAIFAFRVGPEDAKALAAVMSPSKEKEVAKYLAALPNHHVLVRKNPTAATAGFSRVMSIAYPRLPPPLHSEADVIDFMRYKMDALYGGDDETDGKGGTGA